MKIRNIFYCFSAPLILSACNGINIRVFPESIPPQANASAILKYEATRCIPFISCSYHFNIIVPGTWEMYNKTIIIKPDEVNNQYAKFTGIKSTLSSPGNYILRSIELSYGDYSYFLNDKNYNYDDENIIQYENHLIQNYDLNMYSFISYNNNHSPNKNNQGRKVPLRIGCDPSMFTGDIKSYNMNIPLPFRRIDNIDLHFTDNIFRRPDPTPASELMRASYNKDISNNELASRDFEKAKKLNPENRPQ